MLVGVPRETFPQERRVALTPDALPLLRRAGFEVTVERGAGVAGGFADDEYRAAGATVASRAEVYRAADVVAQVRAPGANPEAGRSDLPLLRPQQVLVGLCEPLVAHEATAALAERGVTLFALELVPRITRAQSMDVLSSMATVAGYKAVLLAANRLPRMFPLLMTAAGTVKPARVLVVGAGVAGLQAIATARRLGAVVEAYDVRPAVREQVESLGARFLELALEESKAEGAGGYARELGEEFYRRQRELMGRAVGASDVVITTAAVPGRRAPVLLTADMVAAMRPGSVVVDLAAERGGNCELTRPGEIVEVGGVTVDGSLDLASSVPYHASQMFARNVASFLAHLVHDGALRVDLEDEITRETLVCRDGMVVHPGVREAMVASGSAGAPAQAPTLARAVEKGGVN